MLDALVGKSSFLPSNGEAKRELKANAIAINKEKVSESYTLDNKDLINNKFILIGKGKKTNYLLVIE
jgi:tyrosyl-tRNA synthetase